MRSASLHELRSELCNASISEVVKELKSNVSSEQRILRSVFCDALRNGFTSEEPNEAAASSLDFLFDAVASAAGEDGKSEERGISLSACVAALGSLCVADHEAVTTEVFAVFGDDCDVEINQSAMKRFLRVVIGTTLGLSEDVSDRAAHRDTASVAANQIAEAAFTAIDKNGSHTIDHSEFMAWLNTLGLGGGRGGEAAAEKDAGETTLREASEKEDSAHEAASESKDGGDIDDAMVLPPQAVPPATTSEDVELLRDELMSVSIIATLNQLHPQQSVEEQRAAPRSVTCMDFCAVLAAQLGAKSALKEATLIFLFNAICDAAPVALVVDEVEVAPIKAITAALATLCSMNHGETVDEVFRVFDLDRNNTLSMAEIKYFLNIVLAMTFRLKDPEVLPKKTQVTIFAAAMATSLFDEIDTDHNGTITKDEFALWLRTAVTGSDASKKLAAAKSDHHPSWWSSFPHAHAPKPPRTPRPPPAPATVQEDSYEIVTSAIEETKLQLALRAVQHENARLRDAADANSAVSEERIVRFKQMVLRQHVEDKVKHDAQVQALNDKLLCFEEAADIQLREIEEQNVAEHALHEQFHELEASGRADEYMLAVEALAKMEMDHADEMVAIRSAHEEVRAEAIGSHSAELASYAEALELHKEELNSHKGTHTEQMNALMQEMEDARATHAEEIDSHKEAHAEALDSHNDSSAEQMSTMMQEMEAARVAHAEDLDSHKVAHAEALDSHKGSSAEQMNALMQEMEAARAAHAEELDSHKEAHAEALDSHKGSYAEQMSTMMQEMESARAAHAEELDSHKEAHAEELDSHRGSYAEQMSALTQEMEAARAAHAEELDSHKGAHAEALDSHKAHSLLHFEAHTKALEASHAETIDSHKAAHAELTETHAAAIEAHATAIETERENQLSALAQVITEHDVTMESITNELSEQLVTEQEARVGDRESLTSESKSALGAARATHAEHIAELHEAHAVTITAVHEAHAVTIAAVHEALSTAHAAHAEVQVKYDAAVAMHAMQVSEVRLTARDFITKTMADAGEKEEKVFSQHRKELEATRSSSNAAVIKIEEKLWKHELEMVAASAEFEATAKARELAFIAVSSSVSACLPINTPRDLPHLYSFSFLFLCLHACAHTSSYLTITNAEPRTCGAPHRSRCAQSSCRTREPQRCARGPAQGE